VVKILVFLLSPADSSLSGYSLFTESVHELGLAPPIGPNTQGHFYPRTGAQPAPETCFHFTI
jgi:hypothetical protein